MKTYVQQVFGARRRFVAAMCLSYFATNPGASFINAAPPTEGNLSQESVSEVCKAYEKPRVRYVLGTKALIRSGPSDRYYATDELPAGSRVEVYLETNDGWSGVRPPTDSYNWVLAKHAYLLPGGKIAEISEDETPAWVGSDTANVGQLMWQTALIKSQQVQILGEEYQIGGDGAKLLWYRISPPQGEFRWIRSSALTDQTPASSIAPSNVTKQNESTVVKHASYVEPNTSQVMQAAAQNIQSDDASDGQIVWSDESEVIARINQEIRNEQSEMMGQMPSGALTDEMPVIEDGAIVNESMSVEAAMTPQELLRAKRRQQAQHQVDSLQHWDNMHNASPGTPKARPLGNILGLIGLGIIEAERAPVNTQLRQNRHQFHNTRSTPSIPYQYSSSRLDRLPRPGQRSNRSDRTLPYQEADERYREDLLGASFDDGKRSLDSQRPIMERLLTSNQPLFGSDQPTPSVGGPDRIPDSYEPSANDWHGITPPDVNGTMVSHARILDEPLGVITDADLNQPTEETRFSTPEVQRSLIELSRIVSKPTEDWELGRLRARCMDWIETGESAIARGEARLLLDRIESFENLRQRTLQSLPAGGNDWRARSPMLSTQPSTIPASATPNGGVVTASASRNIPTESGPFASPTDLGAGDASGWLVQVHSTSPGQPEYALTDDAGNVITYVRSTASLNLRRYLQQPVMVQGVRGYIPALAAKQIVAERVLRLR